MAEAERIFKINLKADGTLGLSRDELEKKYREQLPEDIITESTKVGNNSSNNKTDVLIKFQKSNPLKISAKLGNAGYFGNWYGHERFINEFGRKVFDKLTAKTSLWANEWANKSNANLFVGVSISFGERTGDTFIPFLDIFDNL
jgi:hypothetical protein